VKQKTIQGRFHQKDESIGEFNFFNPIFLYFLPILHQIPSNFAKETIFF
jgi:hypothetical protein